MLNNLVFVETGVSVDEWKQCMSQKQSSQIWPF